MIHRLRAAAESPATGQAVEIAKQILEKLTDAAKAAQTTVEQALPHVVKAYMMRQLGYTAACAFLFIAGLTAVGIAARHQVADGHGDPTGWLAPIIIGGIAAVIGTIGLVFNMGDTFAVLADPVGAFILSLIGK